MFDRCTINADYCIIEASCRFRKIRSIDKGNLFRYTFFRKQVFDLKKKLFSEVPYLEKDGMVIRRITQNDAEGLERLRNDSRVYQYLPTFLFEKKYEDVSYVIEQLYEECFRDSIILGVFEDGEFCGLVEMYGYREELHKISVGGRFCSECWGRNLASRALQLMIKYLYEETEIEIITASSMIENKASARVLEKSGFSLVVRAAEEDWGFDMPTRADKWIR